MYCLSLDESGNIKSKKNMFFVISILELKFNESIKLKKIKNTLNKNYKKELRRNNEIKFYSQSENLTKKALNELNKLNFNSYSMIFNNNDSLNKRLLKKYSINQIYMDMVIELLKKINLNTPFILRMDRQLPRKFIKQLNSDIMNNPHIFTENCEIFHNNSVNFVSIQFADLIAGSCFQHYEKGNSEFIDIFKDKLSIYFYQKSYISK